MGGGRLRYGSERLQSEARRSTERPTSRQESSSRPDTACSTVETTGASTSRRAAQRNEFIEKHGFDTYASWHLGVNDEKNEGTKERYEFPCGDFRDVHRCALLAAESRAGQYRHNDIELAAAHLLGMLDEER